MPSKTPKQAKFMRAIAHGWTPSRAKNPPSRAVAQEFVDADRKYSGGFAENRYWVGGLAAMDKVNAGFQGSLDNPFREFEEGGEVDYRVPGEPGVYEAPDVEGMGPALEQMFADMEATRKGKETEVIDYTWDKTQSREAETPLDEKLDAMSGPEQVAYVKPRLLAAMQEMKTIGESPKFKKYSIKDYWLSTDQVSLWRGKWSEALQKQAREAKGPMPTEEELSRIGVDDEGNPIMMEEAGMQRGGRARRRIGRVMPLDGGNQYTSTTYKPQPIVTAPTSGGRIGGVAGQPTRYAPPATVAPTTTSSGPRMTSGTASRRGTGRRGRGGRRNGGGGDGRPGGGRVGGSGTTSRTIIPTDPASYVGGAAAGASGAVSPHVEQLRQHQAKIAATLGSARGGHVTGYAEGGTTRADNPFDPVKQKYQWRSWERKYGRDPDVAEPEAAPPPEPEAVAEEEDGGVAQWLRDIFTPDPESAIGSGESRGTTEEQLEEMEQAYGGRVRYQAGGLATAAPGRILPPAGGVPPWIEPVGSGPGFMDEPEQGYQFGGIAARMGPAMRMARQMRGRQQGGGGQYRGVPPQRGGIQRGAPPGGGGGGVWRQMFDRAQQQRGAGGGQPGGLAAMMRQAQQQQGAAQPGGGGVFSRIQQQLQAQREAGAQPGAATQGGFMAQLRQMQQQQQQQAPAGGTIGGGPGELLNLPPPDPNATIYDRDWPPRGPMAPGGGPLQPGRVGTLGGPGYGEYPLGSAGPRINPSDPRYRDFPGPGGGFAPGEGIPGGGGIPSWKQRRRIAPPPGKEPGGYGRPGGVPGTIGGFGGYQGDGGGGIPGGPRVPPNMQGYLQKMRMMNRPPANVGGGANRVGMADQQGAMSRAMQRGTGRAPPSRRFGRGRAGAGRGFQQR